MGQEIQGFKIWVAKQQNICIVYSVVACYWSCISKENKLVYFLYTDNEIDYIGVETTFLLTPNNTNQCLNITVIDDDAYEKQNEIFRVVLSSDDPIVRYRVKSATISIVSSDRKSPKLYSVHNL